MVLKISSTSNNVSLWLIIKAGTHFGQSVGAVDGCVADVPEGGGLDDVADDELADGLVLRDGLAAVHAPDVAHVAATVLRTAVVAPLRSHLQEGRTDSKFMY